MDPLTILPTPHLVPSHLISSQVVQAVLEYGGAPTLPIAADLVAGVLTLIDDATPLAADVTADARRDAQRATFLALEESYMPQLAPRVAQRSSAPANTSATSAAHAHLVGWLRTLHALVLTCDESLQAERGGARKAEGAAGAQSADGAEHGQRDGGADAVDGGDGEVGEGGLDGDLVEDEGVSAAPPRGGNVVVGLGEDEPLHAFFGKLVGELAPEGAVAACADGTASAAQRKHGDATAAAADDDDDDDDGIVEHAPDGTLRMADAKRRGTKAGADGRDPAEAEAETAAESEAAVRAAEEAEAAANKPPPAGALALEALGKVEVLLLGTRLLIRGCPPNTGPSCPAGKC
jgi:hypothetical protein